MAAESDSGLGQAAAIERAAAIDAALRPAEVLDAVTPVERPRKPEKPRLVRGLPDPHRRGNHGNGKHLKTTKEIDRRKRAVVKAHLTSGERLPLEVMLSNMNWGLDNAIRREKLLAGVETREGLEEVRAYRAFAQDSARDAAPFLHARLAPIVPKGEKGLVVNLTIEDA